MILPFSQQFDGKPTFFIYKIWNGLINEGRFTYSDYNKYLRKYDEKFKKTWDLPEPAADLQPIIKKHTMREDLSDRYKVGCKLHMYVNNRQKTAFNFLPVIECVSIQRCTIQYIDNTPQIHVDGKMLKCFEIKKLAKNDGFDSVEDFFKWFNKDWTGKIIHWTSLKY